MKKFSLIALFIICTQLIAFAQNITWEQICPSKYLNAKSKTVMWYWTDARKQDVQEENYWADRKILFDIELEQCNKLQDIQQRNICLESLNKHETEKNDEHYKEMAIKTQKLIKESREIIDESTHEQPSYNLHCNPNDHLNQSLFWHY